MREGDEPLVHMNARNGNAYYELYITVHIWNAFSFKRDNFLFVYYRA